MKDLTTTPLMDIIRSIFDLEIVEDEKEEKITFTGILKDKSDITVNLSFSIAPSLQSMLSRMGRVEVTCWIKINGNTAVYDKLGASDMNEVGGYLSQCHQEVQKQLDEEAGRILEGNINPKKS